MKVTEGANMTREYQDRNSFFHQTIKWLFFLSKSRETTTLSPPPPEALHT